MIKSSLQKGLLEVARRRFQTRRVPDAPHVWPKGFVITGFFNDEFGLARSAELTALKLEAQGFQILRHDIRELLGKKPLFGHSIDAPDGFGWIIHANPPEALVLFTSINPNAVPTGLRLAYWAWELGVVPKSWAQLASAFDDILVPSKFVQDSLAARNISSTLLSHPVSVGRTVNWVDCRKSSKARTFLIQMDGNSSFDRKNILTGIKAFKKTFAGKTGFELILKTRSLTEVHEQKIRTELDGVSNVRWLNWSLGEASYQELWTRVDCVLSTHRSEGFGLGLAEAAWLNRPVIGTGWSGNMDFMSGAKDGILPYQLIPVKTEDELYGEYAETGTHWAEVEVEHVVEAMCNVADTGFPNQTDWIRGKLAELEKAWDYVCPGSDVAVTPA